MVHGSKRKPYRKEYIMEKIRENATKLTGKEIAEMCGVLPITIYCYASEEGISLSKKDKIQSNDGMYRDVKCPITMWD